MVMSNKNRIYRKRIRNELKQQLRDLLNPKPNTPDIDLVDFLIDGYHHEYRMFEHHQWLEYLGMMEHDLDAELEYCDRVMADWQPED